MKIGQGIKSLFLWYKHNNTIPMWQKDMAFWVNKRMILTITEFKDFEPRKNFKCKEYFK